MSPNHFICPYAGNKRNEFKHLQSFINIDDYDIIIEPFCGSSAISFNLWKNGNKDKIYILNDNDITIYELYTIMKKEEPDDILTEITKIRNGIPDKEAFIQLYKSKDFYIYEKLYFKKFYQLREGLYPSSYRPISPFNFTKEQLLFFEFIKSPNVIISNEDWYDVFKRNENSKKSLFIFDPPYLNSCNEFYGNLQNTYHNVYEFFSNNDISIFQSKIFFLLENNWIIKILFKGKILYEYGKEYHMTKKKTNHIIISN